jgi:tripartite-type tricarboxylate transporter receptor subunit TctC
MVASFAPVSLAWKVPNVMVVNTALPARTVRDLVEYARANPGKLQYASAGVGTSTHLAMELFKKQAGINVLHVPYKGAPQAIVDLLGGQIHVMFGNVTAQLPHLRGGKLRALAVTSAARSERLSDVPTMRQAGYADVEFTVWVGVATPAGVPGPILARLNAALVRALNLPDVVASLAAHGSEAAFSTRADFAAFQKAEIARWMPVAKEAAAHME